MSAGPSWADMVADISYRNLDLGCTLLRISRCLGRLDPVPFYFEKSRLLLNHLHDGVRCMPPLLLQQVSHNVECFYHSCLSFWVVRKPRLYGDADVVRTVAYQFFHDFIEHKR